LYKIVGVHLSSYSVMRFYVGQESLCQGEKRLLKPNRQLILMTLPILSHLLKILI
jgi:hypothetical protein